MDRNALAELLQALESRRDAEERRREERYTALIERQQEKSYPGQPDITMETRFLLSPTDPVGEETGAISTMNPGSHSMQNTASDQQNQHIHCTLT
ncbi:UNVERIFIED_CONTAM: hypothetical protein FKN15_058238 [Acipenser sinensis]